MLAQVFKSRSDQLQGQAVNHQNLVYLSILGDDWAFRADLKSLVCMVN